MTGPEPAGRVVLVDVSPAEEESLAGLPGAEQTPARDLSSVVTDVRAPVDVVVIGSAAVSALALAQRAHDLAPDAGVVVIAADIHAVRRQVSYTPGVPLDILVAAVDDASLVDRVAELRRAVVGRRRHSAVLAAVARTTAGSGGRARPVPTSVGALLEHAPTAVVVTSPGGDLLGWNRAAEKLFDLEPAMTGRPVDDLIPGAYPLIRQATEVVGAGARGSSVTAVEMSIKGRALEISAVGSQTDDGRIVALLFVVDVTAQRAVERERDRLVGHVRLLGEVSQLLMTSLSGFRPLPRLADTLVPALADWVSIEVRREKGLQEDFTIRHRDPRLGNVIREAQRLKAPGHSVTEASRRAGEGERVLLQVMHPDELVAHVPDTGLRALVAELGMDSAVAVPIPGRVGIVGSLLLVNSPGSRRFDDTDLELAVEIGRRAGIAIDNARLYAGQRHVATELQQSLLTEPPKLPFAEIAVRYVAAGQQAQVGGDWYDAFRQRDGDLTVVIGDVAGHDTRAAAAMGQLRGLLRGVGFTSGDGPGHVLSAVDEAIDGLELSVIATAVVAQLTASGGLDGVTLGLRWSNAGHPLPVVVQSDGRTRVLQSADGRADLLLGADPAAPRRTQETTLAPGSTLLLYTDGLIERRHQSLDEGLARLLETVKAIPRVSLDRLCDAILHSMVPQPGEDDVAIVAVRPRALATSRARR